MIYDNALALFIAMLILHSVDCMSDNNLRGVFKGKGKF